MKKPEASAALVRPTPGPVTEDFDACLVAIGRDGDRQAFSRLFTHFAPRIKSFLMRGGTPEALAEDLSQETLCVVWRRAATFDPTRAGASTWIFTIARNLRIDVHRRDHVPQALLEDPSDAPDDPPTPDDVLQLRRREASARRALAALDDEQRHLIRLSFFEEHAHAEIARQLNIPLGTAKSRIRRLLARLRELLEDDLK